MSSASRIETISCSDALYSEHNLSCTMHPNAYFSIFYTDTQQNFIYFIRPYIRISIIETWTCYYSSLHLFSIFLVVARTWTRRTIWCINCLLFIPIYKCAFVVWGIYYQIRQICRMFVVRWWFHPYILPLSSWQVVLRKSAKNQCRLKLFENRCFSITHIANRMWAI